MAISGMLLEGLTLLLFGMGSVFVFLSTLVLTMIGMSRLANRLSPPSSQLQSAATASPAAAGDADEHLVAVISAAVSRYRAARP